MRAAYLHEVEDRDDEDRVVLTGRFTVSLQIPASLRVLTRREGLAARVGHDMVLEVRRWRATLSPHAVEGEADAGSLEVVEGHGGAIPLTDRGDGTVHAEVTNARSRWGIEAFSGPMSALDVADDVRIVLDGRPG